MTRTKIISTLIVAMILLATQVLAVGAAPAHQDTNPITGIVESIALDTDPTTGTTTVLVSVVDDMGETFTIRLSLADAAALGLLLEDRTANPDAVGNPISIDPSNVIPNEPVEPPVEEKQHPVGSALSDFFSELLGVDYETIMDYHDEGVGFGVIAQALWMTKALEGDSETFAAILDAKQNHDYSAITLPDGSTPTNWGQFRKAVMADRKKSKENLGAIMSGHADDPPSVEIRNGTLNNGNSNHPDKNQDKGNNGNGKGKDKNKNKGKNH
jgi:hypothetical protein